MSELRRFGPGDALIGLSLVALVLAALLPAYRARAFDRLLEEAESDIEALRTAALGEYGSARSWPEPRDPGRIPEELAGVFGADTTMVRKGYVLEWRVLSRVEHVEAPPTPPETRRLDADEMLTTDQASAEPDPTDLPPESATPTLIPVAHEDGAVVVHSNDERLLAELLRRHGSAVSFVQDTTWILIVSEPGG